MTYIELNRERFGTARKSGAIESFHCLQTSLSVHDLQWREREREREREGGMEKEMRKERESMQRIFVNIHANKR